jgi:SWI/SNF-related matrix-associated actin-dependent regulator 1 of chromatin subfamily A
MTSSCILFPYQKEGARWLAGRTHALLADEPGLGKSAQAIVAADSASAARILVVCPATARENWTREWSKFGSPQRTASSVTICSYNFLTQSEKNLQDLCSKPFDLVIADESHFAKNPAALRTQALYGRLAHRTKRLWALSGTPTPNHAAELWPMMRTFGATTLTYQDFVARYCTSYSLQNRLHITGTADPESIRTLLAPWMKRRTVSEVMPDLPRMLFHDHFVEATPLSDDELREYFVGDLTTHQVEGLRQKIEHEKELLTVAGPAYRDEEIQNRLERLYDYTSSLRKWVGASKMAGVAELVAEELEAGAYDKIVLWAVHTVCVVKLAERLAEFNPVVIYGDTPQKWRQARIDQFNNDPTCKIFIGNIQAAGTAINLPAAHEEIFCEYSWVPSDNLQAAKRCHRAAAGVRRPVRVRFAVLPGGIDEVVLRVVRRKTRELAAIYN